MKITPARIILPVLCLVVGGVMIYAGLAAGWGLVWVLGGGFFIMVGLSAIVLTLAWRLPGRVGALLRHPIVSVLIVAAVLLMLVLTVAVGLF